MKLTSKQSEFVNRYIEHGNATQAYKEAYNASNMKSNTINRKAFELLQKGYIGARIKEIQNDLDKDKIYEIDDILGNFGKIAFANITDIFDFDSVANKIILKGNASKLSELSRDITDCIQSLKTTKDGIEVKLYSKENALAQIARIKGFYSAEKLIIQENSLADLLKNE